MKLFAAAANSPRQEKAVPIRVAIVDDNQSVRAKLAQAVDRFGVCSCVGQFSSAEDALARLPAASPDVVLMYINLPGASGIECVRQLKAVQPQIEFIMLTVYEDTENVFNALMAGASGYLLKSATRQELREAIEQVRAGGSPMTSHIARKVVQSFRQPAHAQTETTGLSPRERQILEYLTKGFLYKEISEALGLSYDTVHNHIRHIYNKLHVRSRGQAVARYIGTARLPAAPTTGQRS